MLTMAPGSVRFATSVGVAPSTTTMQLGDAPPVVQAARTAASQALAAVRNPASVHPTRYYMPYASLEDLRSAHAGLGIINESDAWLTGRPYGLPGTATVQLLQRPGGYTSPSGYHYNAAMLGDADTANIAAQMQQLVEAQKQNEKSLKQIAFWQAVAGSLTVAGIITGVVLAATRGR